MLQQVIISSLTGMAGSWISSYLGKGSSYGQIANLALGAIGGNGASALLPMLTGAAAGAATGGGDTSSMITGALSSLVGGGALTALSSFLPKSNA